MEARDDDFFANLSDDEDLQNQMDDFRVEQTFSKMFKPNNLQDESLSQNLGSVV